MSLKMKKLIKIWSNTPGTLLEQEDLDYLRETGQVPSSVSNEEFSTDLIQLGWAGRNEEGQLTFCNLELNHNPQISIEIMSKYITRLSIEKIAMNQSISGEIDKIFLEALSKLSLINEVKV